MCQFVFKAYCVFIDIGDWTIALKSTFDDEHIVRSGKFAFEGINKDPTHTYDRSTRRDIYKTGNVTGLLVRRKFVGKTDCTTLIRKNRNIVVRYCEIA